MGISSLSINQPHNLQLCSLIQNMNELFAVYLQEQRDVCGGGLNALVWFSHLQKNPQKPANGEWRTDVYIKVKRIPISDKQPERKMLDNL